MIRCAPSSSGCSGAVRRVAELDRDAAAGGAEDAQRAVALHAVLAHARAELDHLEAEPGARAREAADDLARLARRELHRRPGVEQQPVPVQALARRPAGLHGAHRLERLAHHPLELRQRGDAAGLVADRREVAHLGERDEPLVARVLVRDGAEQVDVLGRGQPLERRTRAAATRPSARPSSGACRARSGPRRTRRRRRARRCARRPRRRAASGARTNTTRATAVRQLGARPAARRGPRAASAARRRRPAPARRPGACGRARRARAAPPAARRARRASPRRGGGDPRARRSRARTARRRAAARACPRAGGSGSSGASSPRRAAPASPARRLEQRRERLRAVDQRGDVRLALGAVVASRPARPGGRPSPS